MTRALLACLLVACAGIAHAHEIHSTVEASGAVVIALSYADGSPFAYEKYELYPADQTMPQQVGNSDAHGRIVFLAGEVRDWRLRAFSADGHGIDLRFTAPAVAGVATDTAQAPARPLLLVAGLAVLFGVFGLIQLFLRRSKP